jgi:predicted outer membrane repeat protein
VYFYHVIAIDATGNATNVSGSTILDGFTITGGKANGSGIDQYGGGLICNGNTGYTCNPTLANLVFKNNSAVYGGALMSNGSAGGMSSPRLQKVTFSANHASTAGGAMYNLGVDNGASSPALTAVDFSGNTSDNSGGAMYNLGIGGVSSPSVVASHFDGNVAAGNGGAVYNETSNASFTDVTFTGNHSSYQGGAVYNRDVLGPENLQFTSVTFTGNSAYINGGAVYNSLGRADSQARFDHTAFAGNTLTANGIGGAVYNSGNAVFRDVLFAGNGGVAQLAGAIANTTDVSSTSNLTIDGASFVRNTAIGGSGAVLVLAAQPATANTLISNATFWKNAVAFNGGAIQDQSASIVLRNVTFGGNTAAAGGALDVYNFSGDASPASATISNAILWGDSATNDPEIQVGAGTTVAIDHSIVQNGCPTGATCSTLSSADPLLGLFQLYGGFTPALMPAANSPAINNGANCPATDQRGVARPQGAACDIGAVERRAVEDYLFNNGFDW